MKRLVEQLNTTTSYVVSGGKSGEKTRQRHLSKGKLLARDRIKYLLDSKYNKIKLFIVKSLNQ